MKAIVFIGCPGSGKSTIAKSLMGVFEGQFVHIERDMMREKLAGGRKAFHALADKTKEQKVSSMVNAAIEQAAKEGKGLILSDTNINPLSRKTLISALTEKGYDVEIHLIVSKLGHLIIRNERRPIDEQVPIAVIQQMHKALEKQLDEGVIKPNAAYFH